MTLTATLKLPPETEDTFTNGLQMLVRKIIMHKPSFYLEANNQFKAQYTHKLWDPYYVAMTHNALQSSPEETLTRFWGCLVTMCGRCMIQRKSTVTSKDIDTEVNQISDLESKLSKNSRQHQNKINKQEAQINSLQNQNTQLKGLLDPTLLVDVIS